VAPAHRLSENIMTAGNTSAAAGGRLYERRRSGRRAQGGGAGWLELGPRRGVNVARLTAAVLWKMP
jgi:hypothetical protein